LISSQLNRLYEGYTIAYLDKAPNLLSVLATSSDGNPVILFGANKNDKSPGKIEEKFGRIVLDTGFTKLWKEWNTEGNPRYICNATVWLLGLDYRMNCKYDPLKGPLQINPPLNRLPPKLTTPKDTEIGTADIVMIIDGSGSVGEIGFESMRQFCQAITNTFEISSNQINFGLVQFASVAKIEVGLSGNRTVINEGIKNMKFMNKKQVS